MVTRFLFMVQFLLCFAAVWRPLPALGSSDGMDCPALKRQVKDNINLGNFDNALSNINELEGRCSTDAHLLFDKMRVYIALDKTIEAQRAGLRLTRLGLDGSLTPDKFAFAEKQLAEQEGKLRQRGFGQVVVTLVPPDATLIENGTPVAEFPGSGQPLWLPAGHHTLRAECKDYEPSEQQIEVKVGQTTTLPPLALTKRLPPPALLTVTGTPAGADVLFDDTTLGVLPVTDVQVPPGAHTLTVAKIGFGPSAQSIELEAGQKATSIFLLALKAPPPRPPTDLHPWGWVTTGVGGALVLVGSGLVYLYVQDVKTRNNYFGKPNLFPGMTSDERRAKGETFAKKADRDLAACITSYVAGGSALVAGILMELLNPARRHEAAKPTEGSAPGARAIEFWQPPGLFGAGLSGQF